MPWNNGWRPTKRTRVAEMVDRTKVAMPRKIKRVSGCLWYASSDKTVYYTAAATDEKIPPSNEKNVWETK